MDIFDAHTHIFPDRIAEKATISIGKFYGLGMANIGTASRLIESGSRIGAKGYLVCSVARKPRQAANINDFIAMQTKANQSFIGFGTVHPYMDDPNGEISRFIELGLKGIKLHSDLQDFPIDDEKAFPIYKKAESEGLPILFHCGDSRFEFAYSSPLRLIRVLEKFPRLKAIAAHFGGYSEWEHVTKYPKVDGLRFDTCSSLFILPKEKSLELIETYGADRFFFGTDFPMWDHVEELERFKSLGLSEEDQSKMLYSNFASFIGLS